MTRSCHLRVIVNKSIDSKEKILPRARNAIQKQVFPGQRNGARARSSDREIDRPRHAEPDLVVQKGSRDKASVAVVHLPVVGKVRCMQISVRARRDIAIQDARKKYRSTDRRCQGCKHKGLCRSG